MYKILIIALTFFSIQAQASSSVEAFAHSKEWYRVLHYKKNILGVKSEIQGSHFFVSPKGRTSPEVELRKFLRDSKVDHTLRCRFPLRTKVLVNAEFLNNSFLDFSSCTNYKKYILTNRPSTISLVFSSYFMESPGSAFGHTFLRFGREQGNELLDIGVNYGANVTSENPILYALFGITGGFKGQFSAMPFFYKVREYISFESRDLWSYELGLSTDEMSRILDHLWEIDKAEMPYYFFTKNCSYVLLSVLEVGNVNWDFTSKLPFYIIPVETIKVISENSDLIKEVKYRPSAKKQFTASLRVLNTKQKKSLDSYINSGFDISRIKGNSKQTSSIIDAAIDYIDYKHAGEVLREEGEVYARKKDLLVRRSKAPTIKRVIPEVSSSERPDMGHDPNRTILMFGKNKKDEELLTLKYRIAMHDKIDPVLGQPKFANITFFDFTSEYNITRDNFKFEKFTLFDVETLNPWSFNHYPISYKAKVTYNKDRSSYCFDCKRGGVELSSGVTFSLSEQLLFAVFSDIKLYFSNSFKDGNLKEDLGIRATLLYRTLENLSLHLCFQRQYSFSRKTYFSSQKLDARLSLNKYFSLSSEFLYSKTETKYLGGVIVYF